MAVLGNTDIVGTATTAIDATGAAPATVSPGVMSFDVPIPHAVPTAGVIVELPHQAETIGPFTSGENVTVLQSSTVELALSVSGKILTMVCTAFANDGLATGIASSPPTSKPLSLLLGTVDNELAITTASRLPAGVVGWHYATTLGAAGGAPPYAWRVVAGSGKLPKGLALDSSTGVISGTPTKAGGATFSVKVLDNEISNAGTRRKIVHDSVTEAVSIFIW
jgi:large repetitive protein